MLEIYRDVQRNQIVARLFKKGEENQLQVTLTGDDVMDMSGHPCIRDYDLFETRMRGILEVVREYLGAGRHEYRWPIVHQTYQYLTSSEI